MNYNKIIRKKIIIKSTALILNKIGVSSRLHDLYFIKSRDNVTP